ncbi:hypothetical protein Lal_00009219 [Lupinus albus]|nr:hypothetical protein Lal_00009219 [Lupinus albus]
MSTTIEKIQRQIAENPILLYMKGSPKLPSCGFSAQAVQALSACGERFAYVDILQNPDIRAELPKYANWPTFPQLWVDGELVGGCDILIEMYQRGELQQLIKETAAKYKTEEPDADDLLCGRFFFVGWRRAYPTYDWRSASSSIGSGQPPRRFQRLTISQNSSAVRSVSYSAECACVPSNGMPAVIQAFDKTRQAAQRGGIEGHKRVEGVALERGPLGGGHGKAVIEGGVMSHHNGAAAVALLHAFAHHFKNGVQRIIFTDGTAQRVMRIDTVKRQRFRL